MVEVEFGEEGKVFAVNGVFESINFEDGESFFLVSVYLIAGRVVEGAFE